MLVQPTFSKVTVTILTNLLYNSDKGLEPRPLCCELSVFVAGCDYLGQ